MLQKYNVTVLQCCSSATYFTEREKSPGELSLTRIRNAPSCLFNSSFSASALVILP